MAAPSLGCGMWDLSPWLGIQLPALGVQSLRHWTTREVPSPPYFSAQPHPTYIPGFWRQSVQFSSAAQSCPTFCDPMDCSTPGYPVLTNSWRLLKLMSIESVMPSNHLILYLPLLLFPSIFPSIRVFSNESVICIRWPKYWNFSFSISPSSEYSGLIFFRKFSNLHPHHRIL